MSDIDKRLDEILENMEHIDGDGNVWVASPETKQAIKQLMADEFEKAKIEQTELIRNRFVRDGWEYKWLTEIIDELRQKLEELKK